MAEKTAAMGVVIPLRISGIGIGSASVVRLQKDDAYLLAEMADSVQRAILQTSAFTAHEAHGL